MTISTGRMRALGLALGGWVAMLPAYAGEPTEQPGAGSKQSDIGAATGIAVGALAAGPVGAVLGGAAGALLGDRYHRQAQSSVTLGADLERSEQQRAQLERSTAELDGALAQARAHGAKLADTLSHTDELGFDVGFRTDDDSVSAQAMSPLLKLGALAASLPQARVCVTGFTDPRGPEAYNTTLSLRRAANVAAVLASAGVARERIVIEGRGKAGAGDLDGDLDTYALERRVTVRLQLTYAPAEVARRD